MKKLNIIIYSLTALCCIGFLTACVASIDTSTPSISLNPSLKDCPIRFKKKDVYRLDIDSKIEFVIPKGVTYKTYYERDEKFYSNDFPTEVGTYSFIIETNANKYYKATKKWKVFNLVSDKKYNVETKTLSINYADEKWHTLEIYYNHSNPSAYVKLDNITIYEFDSAKLPTVEYVKPHIGLLYPQNPTWTGIWKSDVSNYARVGNYEAYKVNGDSQ